MTEAIGEAKIDGLLAQPEFSGEEIDLIGELVAAAGFDLSDEGVV